VEPGQRWRNSAGGVDRERRQAVAEISASAVVRHSDHPDDTKAIIAELREKFPDIEGPRKDDICYATQNRQDAVRRLADAVDLMLVVGSVNSSNSNRLRELAEKQGVRSFLIDGAENIDRSWLDGVQHIGLTAGASAPDKLVRDVIARLQSWGVGEVRELDGEPENITFALPKELRVLGGSALGNL
jgi:4-hydroxy-3-methylbut-2-enyl diphosphate reductase